ncbi:Amuc_1098 family type IV pilus outer membrane protein [Prosthecobacter vanneervenii]|uniref:General secretion pathway protein D n=1 Tax=Prosthecobacter vanneervenii TaxID=48466 RepID=A0A7W7YC42_9BACT|nr:general secretion pathway protein D [Prosthecobacter vanneervenii]
MTHHSRLVFNLSLLVLSAGASPIMAQSSVSGMANREIARRYARIEDARTAMDRGDKLFSGADYEGALGSYKAAIESLPNAPLTRDWLDLAQLKYADCSVTVAQERAKAGDYKAARELLDGAIKAVPGHKAAAAFAKQLDDPDRWPPALTAEHVTNVGKVQAGLLLANSSVEIGNYDAAISQYQDVIRVDPYNSAARRGMENAERKRQEYFKSAYDHQRAKMLSQVAEAWEDKVPVQGAAVAFDYGVGRSPGAYLTEKMNKIVFPSVKFDNATIDEAIEFLRVKSRDLDTFTEAGGVKGVNIILRQGEAPSNASISLDLKDVPMSEALRYVTELAQMKYKVEAHAVLVVPLSENASEQYTRSYRVPPDFLSNGGGDAGAAAPAAPAADPFAAGGGGGGGAGGSGLIARRTAKQILEAAGINFPEGSSASYNPATSQLVVRNTQPNLDLVEAYVESITKSAPKMVVITSKFVEITQKNTEELGFDWLLGAYGAGNVFLGGGTTGNGNAYNSANYPFASNLVQPGYNVGGTQVFPNIPVAGAFAGLIPTGAVNPATITAANPTGTPTFPYGGGPMTSGNRSGGYAVNNSSIDNLLTTGSTTGTTSVAPGIFSTAGIFSDPQFQTVMRGLSQKKGVDLMSAPSVTTKSGTRATMEVTREFIYPTEFDPPRLPQGNGGLNLGGGGGGNQIATPTTPTAFEMRQTGVRLEAEPTVGADGNTIELTLAPEVVEFDGFINYGSPILSPSSQSVLSVISIVTDALGNQTAVQGYVPLQQPERLITPNIINQPVFSVRKVTTGVSIWDGQTVALGGLMREDVQDVQDKLPILGDLPIVGRLFKSEAEQHYKRNLMIFVTAHLIDPAGQRIKPVNSQASGGADAAAAASGGNALLPPVSGPVN